MLSLGPTERPTGTRVGAAGEGPTGGRASSKRKCWMASSPAGGGISLVPLGLPSVKPKTVGRIPAVLKEWGLVVAFPGCDGDFNDCLEFTLRPELLRPGLRNSWDHP